MQSLLRGIVLAPAIQATFASPDDVPDFYMGSSYVVFVFVFCSGRGVVGLHKDSIILGLCCILMNGRRHMVDEEALFAASDFPIPPQDRILCSEHWGGGGVAFERAPFLVKVVNYTMW